MTEFYVPKTQKALYLNAWAWVIGILAMVAIISVSLWAAGVFTASVRGQAGAYKAKESTTNRLFAQQNFEQLSADIDGYVAKIVIARQAVKTSPSDITRTNLTGVQQVCVDAVQQYNADSRKYLLRDFKSAGLPQTRDQKECA